MIKPLIPQMHNRALKTAIISRVRGLTKMHKSVAEVIYKELTGDESSAENQPAAERATFFAEQLNVRGAHGRNRLFWMKESD